MKFVELRPALLGGSSSREEGRYGAHHLQAFTYHHRPTSTTDRHKQADRDTEQTQTQTQTDRQTDRQTHTSNNHTSNNHTQTDRHRHRHTDTDTDTETHRDEAKVDD